MSSLTRFERIARKAAAAAPQIEEPGPIHPFDDRNIHPAVVKVARKLFDDAHYPQATFEACKLIDKEVSKIGGIQKTGFDLMMQAFSETNPVIKLTDMSGRPHPFRTR